MHDFLDKKREKIEWVARPILMFPLYTQKVLPSFSLNCVFNNCSFGLFKIVTKFRSPIKKYFSTHYFQTFSSYISDTISIFIISSYDRPSTSKPVLVPDLWPDGQVLHCEGFWGFKRLRAWGFVQHFSKGEFPQVDHANSGTRGVLCGRPDGTNLPPSLVLLLTNGGGKWWQVIIVKNTNPMAGW